MRLPEEIETMIWSYVELDLLIKNKEIIGEFERILRHHGASLNSVCSTMHCEGNSLTGSDKCVVCSNCGSKAGIKAFTEYELRQKDNSEGNLESKCVYGNFERVKVWHAENVYEWVIVDKKRS
jgi:hypothetical protein